MFNAKVPLPDGDVFLMNTFTDAQLRVSADVAAWLDGCEADAAAGRPRSRETLPNEERDTADVLAEHGLLVSSREAEREALAQRFDEHRGDTSQLRVTVLTTLQCNFACGYCVQGDHAHYDAYTGRMSLATADGVAEWVEGRLDAIRPASFVLTFFGGEPLLNLPATYALADRLWAASQARGVRMLVNLITNGLLLTPKVVDRLLPVGLSGIKVTLDGDRESHDRVRPLRGGQGTFDRILTNLSRIAGRCPITIGGNVEPDAVDRYPALLALLREQPFAESVTKVSFKPVIRTAAAPAPQPLIPLSGLRAGAAVTAAASPSPGPAGGSPCDTCHFVDDHLEYLRAETRRHGFPTPDGVHQGPCEIHRRHAYTIGPDGTLYACPGFASENALAVGHVEAGRGAAHEPTAARFARLTPWDQCGDCEFIPVCAGGCVVASHHERGDMTAPTCHKRAFDSALVSLAYETAGIQGVWEP
jgi:uncharacterized protein